MVDLYFDYDTGIIKDAGETSWESHILKDMVNYPIPGEWLEKAKEGESLPVCLDVGANVGLFTSFYKDVFKRFICIEASRSNCKRMGVNFQKQGLQHTQIKRAAAWSDSTSGFKLGYGPDKARAGDCTMWKKGSSHKEYETVPTISLEGLLKTYGLREVSLLKVDIEGSEYEFLYGKDLSKIHNLVIELHSGQVGKDKIKKLVEHIMSFGFSAVVRRSDSDIASELAQAAIQHGNARVAPKELSDISILEGVGNLESLQYGCPTVLFTKGSIK